MPTSQYSFSESRSLLESTPAVLRALLAPLPDRLLRATEGPGTWSPIDVLAHLAWGEVDDWLPRVRIILEHGADRPFTPFDREAGFAKYRGWSAGALLDEFARLRAESLASFDALGIEPGRLRLEGRHPELGRVTLEQLLATWVTHDLAHLAQIARVLARHHGQFVGPWRAFFSLLKESAGPAPAA